MCDPCSAAAGAAGAIYAAKKVGDALGNGGFVPLMSWMQAVNYRHSTTDGIADAEGLVGID